MILLGDTNNRNIFINWKTIIKKDFIFIALIVPDSDLNKNNNTQLRKKD